MCSRLAYAVDAIEWTSVGQGEYKRDPRLDNQWLKVGSGVAIRALEASVILRAVGAPISPTGALAVETFSRVASFDIRLHTRESRCARSLEPGGRRRSRREEEARRWRSPDGFASCCGPASGWESIPAVPAAARQRIRRLRARRRPTRRRRCCTSRSTPTCRSARWRGSPGCQSASVCCARRCAPATTA